MWKNAMVVRILSLQRAVILIAVLAFSLTTVILWDTVHNDRNVLRSKWFLHLTKHHTHNKETGVHDAWNNLSIVIPTDHSSTRSSTGRASTLASSSSSSSYSSFSSPRSPSLLFMAASYSLEQIPALRLVIASLSGICNGGWHVAIRLQVSNGLNYSHPLFAQLQNDSFCQRIGRPLDIAIDEYDQIGFGLNSKHRGKMLEYIDNFDYFSYAEEDMVLTLEHMTTLVRDEANLKLRLPRTHLSYCLGFLRYEISVSTGKPVTWEYLPHQVHVAYLPPSDPPSAVSSVSSSVSVSLTPGAADIADKFIVTNNLNQAIFVFSKQQLKYLQSKCEFLTNVGQNAFYKELRKAQNLEWKYMSVGVSEWSSSFQQILQCGVRRIIPADHFLTYMIHHGTDKAHKRRLKREHLSMEDWYAMITNKSSTATISMDEAYDKHVKEQYNLHLMDPSHMIGKVKWSWGVKEDVEIL